MKNLLLRLYNTGKHLKWDFVYILLLKQSSVSKNDARCVEQQAKDGTKTR